MCSLPFRIAATAADGDAVAWTVTIIGGYALRWTWTGYQANTHWDWLQLLLLALVVPAILLPAALKSVSGKAAQRAGATTRVTPE